MSASYNHSCRTCLKLRKTTLLLRLSSLSQCGRKLGRLSRKGLISKPEFMQQYFATIESLPQSFQLLCLAKVAKKEYSLEDLKKAAKEFRSMQKIQKAFCRCTNNVTWEEACDRFPHFTDSVRLRQFVGLSFKPIPEAFQAFCRAALQMSQSQMKPQVNIASMVAEHMLSRPTLSCYHILISRRHVHYTYAYMIIIITIIIISIIIIIIIIK